jgi:hypothetical protein
MHVCTWSRAQVWADWFARSSEMAGPQLVATSSLVLRWKCLSCCFAIVEFWEVPCEVTMLGYSVRIQLQCVIAAVCERAEWRFCTEEAWSERTNPCVTIRLVREGHLCQGETDNMWFQCSLDLSKKRFLFPPDSTCCCPIDLLGIFLATASTLIRSYKLWH